MCLRDTRRASALRDAISDVVGEGDSVVDIGTGTGILALFACAAGARRVDAIEQDSLLATNAQATFAANGLEDRVKVQACRAEEAILFPPDVLLAELIETGLIDEAQIAVLNGLYRRGVIGSHTRIMPAGYETYLTLACVDEKIHGFQVRAVRHEWPFYDDEAAWSASPVRDASNRVPIWHGWFDQGYINPMVSRRVEFHVFDTVTVNAVRLSGVVRLTREKIIGACNSMNGDKLLPIEPRSLSSGVVRLQVKYEMSAGLESVELRWL